GTMGGGIAALFASVGIPVLLLDVPAEGTRKADRDATAANGLKRALAAKPSLFFEAKAARRIEIGNTVDDFARLGECDLVIEAIFERLEVKREFLRRMAEVRAPQAIVASNTSGIPIHAMAAGLPSDFLAHFLVMHFFNPVRYMKLLEIVPGASTTLEVIDAAREIGETLLGKGVVVAKDTPNFIANRIGVYGFMAVLKRTLESGFGFAEVDAILGEPMGRPRSAIFRTCDLSGLDVLLHVASGVYDGAPEDEQRAVFEPPPLLKELVARGWLGEKTGQGFFKRVKGPQGSEILVLDPASMEYRPREKVRFDSIGAVRTLPDPADRIRGMVQADDRAGRFAREVTLDLLAYAARRVPEISDSITDVDNAMRWGFRWDLGPFQTFDALGVRAVADALDASGRGVPTLVQEVLDRGGGSFYAESDRGRSVFQPSRGAMVPLPSSPADLTARALQRAGATVRENNGARLLDMGEGVGLVAFHTKMNSIDPDVVRMLREAVEEGGGRFRALVIGNDAADFSVGANLASLLMASYARMWKPVEETIRAFQDANMALKYSRVPVVVAPAGRALGGGAEIVMHGAAVRAAAESYIGLVETGVGLVPAGGGCKELLLRLGRGREGHGPFPPTRLAFETIAYATVSTSAAEARTLGFLRATDRISLDRERVLFDARADAISLAESGYAAPEPASLLLPGTGGRLVLEQQIEGLRQTAKISEHDGIVASKLAFVLTGGECSPVRPVTE
ncbi:MAG TPA: 3-hydroxyacyl-CoA dehydrogenase/enoyl-CoA hydratase family protein, partial [Chloroflexota bacterium]|nr:3-hydroxyacyl-CoA dehydrogenase/enoyl-CoA hydratase family protein [Chloroflexota bacterium]